jgi:hypothetical protein
MTSEELTKLGVPPELHGDATLKEIKDVPTAMKVLVDLKSYQGQSIRIPSKEAGAEALAEFHARLKEKVPSLIDVPTDETELGKVEDVVLGRFGKPKDAKGYPSLADAKIELPEGVKIDEDNLRELAIKLKLTKSGYLELARSTVAEQTNRVQLGSEHRKALKTELGEAFEERLLAAASIAKKLGADDATVQAVKNGAADPALTRQYLAAAKLAGEEGGGLGGNSGGGNGKLTPAEAEQKFNEILRNPALFDGADPTHADLVAKRDYYAKIAWPGDHQ